MWRWESNSDHMMIRHEGRIHIMTGTGTPGRKIGCSRRFSSRARSGGASVDCALTSPPFVWRIPMSSTESSVLTFSLTRPRDAPLDPPPQYARLRAEAPISRVSIWGGKATPWLVTRWEDVRAVLSHPAFSSDTTRADFPTTIENPPTMPPGYFFAHDDPVHDLFRRSLTREFMVKRIEMLRAPTSRIVDQLLDAMMAKGAPADFVESVALPLPSLVICELLGVPYADHDFFQSHSKVLIDTVATAEDKTAAHLALGDYLQRLVEERRRQPKDDLVSRLGEHVNAGTFSVRDAADVGAFLLFAGHETTANMIGLGVLALLEQPDQLARLHAGKAELANAVEELLRYLTIAHVGLRRIATEDVTIGGVTIRTGEGVIVLLNSANRDADVFSDADEVDLARANARQHVAFGYGIHQCLGQPLARMELQLVLPEVFRRLPALRIDPDSEVAFKQTSAAYGAKFMPVIW
ncbi:cytochrome P450 [Saccharopolyspora sp. 5N708]|uniref:cytochrome P450 n=1 Tax=Saccharopolyspora sp. 5N708 TaxID=3457424 RepID=UPI003FCEECD5